jgi:formylglycine-generating enzyme required for sulfatase activity
LEGWDAGGTALVTRTERNFVTAQGVKDLVGNTWEWCSDWESFFTEEPISDPVGPATGQYKQVRGGCFADNFERWFQVHTRHVMPPTYNSGTIGFRLVAQGT